VNSTKTTSNHTNLTQPTTDETTWQQQAEANFNRRFKELEDTIRKQQNQLQAQINATQTQVHTIQQQLSQTLSNTLNYEILPALNKSLEATLTKHDEKTNNKLQYQFTDINKRLDKLTFQQHQIEATTLFQNEFDTSMDFTEVPSKHSAKNQALKTVLTTPTKHTTSPHKASESTPYHLSTQSYTPNKNRFQALSDTGPNQQ
jgi:hypothetical protein